MFDPDDYEPMKPRNTHARWQESAARPDVMSDRLTAELDKCAAALPHGGLHGSTRRRRCLGKRAVEAHGEGRRALPPAETGSLPSFPTVRATQSFMRSTCRARPTSRRVLLSSLTLRSG